MFWLDGSKVPKKFSRKHGINSYSLLAIVACHYHSKSPVTGSRFKTTNSRYLAAQFSQRVKGNILPAHAMNACRISGLAPLIHNLDPSGCFALVMTVLPYMPLWIITSTPHFFSFVRITASVG
jgi:hypothetical protein